MYRYHYQVGFPTNLRKPTGKVLLEYTQHALEAANTDRYGAFGVPIELDYDQATLIEAEADRFGNVEKGVYRVRYNARFDLVLVVIIATRRVKTVWLNERADRHHSLRRELYDVPRR